MVITYHGGQCFRVNFGNITLALNPIAKNTKWPTVKFDADVVFVSLKHPHFNGTEQVTNGTKETFVIDGPGEYEVGDVTVVGYGVGVTYDEGPRFNTIYRFNLEGMSIVFLGALAEPEIDTKIFGELGGSDLLFMPIGGGDILNAQEASKLATKLEAKVIIPMHYDNQALQIFLKEEGDQNIKPIDKLTLKKRDIMDSQGQIVVLKS